MYDLNTMTEEEIKEMQKEHREKLAEARDKIKQHKADVRRWICRGKMIESVCKNPENVSDTAFEKRIKELIKKGLEYENAANGSRDSDRP